MLRAVFLGFLTLTISLLAGCSKPAENYVGSWYNESEHSFFSAMQIEQNGKSFIVTIDLLGGNPLNKNYQQVRLSAVYDEKNDLLEVQDQASGTFTITYDQKTGQLFSDLASSFGVQNFVKNTATHGKEFLGTWVSKTNNINIREFTLRRRGDGFVVFTNYFNDTFNTTLAASFLAVYSEEKGKPMLVFPKRNNAYIVIDKDSGELLSTLTENTEAYIRSNP